MSKQRVRERLDGPQQAEVDYLFLLNNVFGVRPEVARPSAQPEHGKAYHSHGPCASKRALRKLCEQQHRQLEASSHFSAFDEMKLRPPW